MSLEIAFERMNREKACPGFKRSATYVFAIFDGSSKTHAEVILMDGGVDIVEHSGIAGKTAARIALQQFLVSVHNPFKNRIFLRIPFRHPEYFVKHGNFHESLRVCGTVDGTG
jgi:hypothetical protein